jgi:hypothetical protein
MRTSQGAGEALFFPVSLLYAEFIYIDINAIYFFMLNMVVYS